MLVRARLPTNKKKQGTLVGKTRAPTGQTRSSRIETMRNPAQGSWSVASAQVQELCAQFSCPLRQRRRLVPVLNDHGLLLISTRIVASLVLKKVLLFIVVASVPLVGGHGHLLALPLIVVDLMPRVGGFGHQKLFRERLWARREHLRV